VWNLVESREMEILEIENAKIASENNVNCIFYPNSIIEHEFVPKNRL
jgi:hypothetical protein